MSGRSRKASTLEGAGPSRDHASHDAKRRISYDAKGRISGVIEKLLAVDENA
jgi:hypothetical protein